MPPKQHVKVYSVLFIGGEPLKKNPYPTKYLGYESLNKVKNVTVKPTSLECRHENRKKILRSVFEKHARWRK